jgi:YesN/AraC family two-component response regulator
LEESFVFEADQSVYLEKSIYDPTSVRKSVDKHKSVLLIVEDNQEVKEYIRMTFSAQYNVIEAGNGQEALQMVKNLNPDIIISDIKMPVMDGVTFCQKLKSDINTSHIPIILLTAKSAVESVLEGAKVGAELYVTKPFQPELLKLQVENLISNRNRIIQKFILGEVSHTQEISENPLDNELLNKAIKTIMQNLANDTFSVEELASAVNMSRSNLFRKLKSLTGQSPLEFIFSMRLKKSLELLLHRKMNVSEIAFEVGFKNPSSFTKAFKKQFGKSPSLFLKEITDKELINERD